MSINFIGFNSILQVIIEHEVLVLEISLYEEEFPEDTCGSSVRNRGLVIWKCTDAGKGQGRLDEAGQGNIPLSLSGLLRKDT